VIYDIDRFGPRRFWLMAMFVCLYTYLALPLFVEFLKVLTRRRAAPAPARKVALASRA
jgi:cellulose synthase (UDP-forming)